MYILIQWKFTQSFMKNRYLIIFNEASNQVKHEKHNLMYVINLPTE